MFNDYSKIAFEAKFKTIYGEGCPLDLAQISKISNNKQLKILCPKQMLQRLPIALTQVKAGNTPENVLNERQTIYSLYRSR